MLLLVAGIAAVVLPYSRAQHRSARSRASSTTCSTRCSRCAWPACSASAITGDAFNVFVFLEISSLSTYVLIALGRTGARWWRRTST